jgi:RNA polymerase sigma-70 factor (ECF subfamily)
VPVIEVKAVREDPTFRAREVDPDVALVAAAREEPRMFLALYDRYFDRVLGYVRLRVRDGATCEDVTSTVFTTALAQLGRFRGDGSFAGWLFQIARNAVYDVHRRPRVAPLPVEPMCSEPDVAEQFLARERVAQLHAVVGLLEPEQQHLLAMRYGAGLAFDEIQALRAPGLRCGCGSWRRARARSRPLRRSGGRSPLRGGCR